MEFTIHYHKYRTMQLNSLCFKISLPKTCHNLPTIFKTSKQKQLNKKGNHYGVCCMKRWVHFNISTLVHVCVL